MTDIPGRLKDMDKLGVAMQVIFPTLFLIYITDDVVLDVAMARAYNRFLAQACAKSGGCASRPKTWWNSRRLRPVSVLSILR